MECMLHPKETQMYNLQGTQMHWAQVNLSLLSQGQPSKLARSNYNIQVAVKAKQSTIQVKILMLKLISLPSYLKMSSVQTRSL